MNKKEQMFLSSALIQVLVVFFIGGDYPESAFFKEACSGKIKRADSPQPKS